MRLNLSLALLLLALAIDQAVSAPKIAEKKSLITESKLEKKGALKIEETGGEKDRAKKSTTTFCVEIRPGSSQPTRVPCDCKDKHESAQINVQPAPQQTLSIVQPAPQPQPTQSVQIVPAPQPTPQPIQTLSIVQPAPQPAPQPQTVNIVQPAPEPAPQPAQTFNIVQPAPEPAPQPAQTLSIVQPAPQPAPQPTQTVHIVPAPQPAPQPAQQTLSIVQPAPQPAPQPAQTLQIVQPAPQPAPQPAQQTLSIVQPAPQPAPQPAQQTLSIVQPAPQQTHASIVLPPAQPAPQSVQHLHIVQPPAQPCPTVNLVPAPQPPQTLNIVQPAPEPAPAPAPAPEPERVEPAPERPRPAQMIVQPPQPVPEATETLNVLPVAPPCNDQMVVVQSNPVMLLPEPEPRPQMATIMQVPNHHCHHHALLTECTCKPQKVALRSSDEGPMEAMRAISAKDMSMGMFRNHHKTNVLPVVMYPSPAPASRAPLMVHCNPSIVNSNSLPVVVNTQVARSGLGIGETNGALRSRPIYQSWNDDYGVVPPRIRGLSSGSFLSSVQTSPGIGGYQFLSAGFQPSQSTFFLADGQPAYRWSDDSEAIDARIGGFSTSNRKIPREADASQLEEKEDEQEAQPETRQEEKDDAEERKEEKVEEEVAPVEN